MHEGADKTTVTLRMAGGGRSTWCSEEPRMQAAKSCALCRSRKTSFWVSKKEPVWCWVVVWWWVVV